MKCYPSSQERLQIIAKRKKLVQEIIHYLTINQRDNLVENLSRKYGHKEVLRMLNYFKESMQAASIKDDEAQLYKEYINHYRRFGGKRPLLDFSSFNRLNFEYTKLYAHTLMGGSLPKEKQDRCDELENLMFKGFIYWEDITPEDPPIAMPEIPIKINKTSKLPKTIQPHDKVIPKCKKDGFPMLKIDGRLECVAEYLDRCIGQKKIIDILERQGDTLLVFEDDHKLPLLCCCCLKPFNYEKVETIRHKIMHRHLENISIKIIPTDENGEVIGIVLGFSKKGIFSTGIELSPLAFEVARELEHPLECPYKGQKDATYHKNKKRRSFNKK